MLDSLRDYFEIFIVILFLISMVCYFGYKLFLEKSVKLGAATIMSRVDSPQLSKKARKKLKHNAINSQLKGFIPKFFYFFADLFWVLFLVVGIRSFIYEPFVIPSKSMKPGLLIGDIVLVNKFTYGIKLPIIGTKITTGSKVQRGDVVVFKYPKDPKISYIKRAIGLPGDKIFYDNDNLTINGKKIALKKVGEAKGNAVGSNNTGKSYDVYEENLFGVTHTIRLDKSNPTIYPNTDLIVPEGQLFVMGDNRDESGDSRAFRFMPLENLIGRGDRIALNWRCLAFKGNCDRFFKQLK